MSDRPEFELTVALMRAAAAVSSGRPVDVEVPSGTIERVDWQRFVRFTSAHFILPAIAPGLAVLASHSPIPSDLLAFVTEMRAANDARNRELGVALGAITARLAESGITAVALKGAAFLAEDEGGAAGWRFMNDLDLLVRPSELQRAVACVERLGFAAEHEDYDPAREAHYPPLIASSGRFCVEIHTRLFASGDHGIDVERLRASALSVEAWGASLRVPSPVDRVAHVVTHAQLHNRQYAARRIVLKDVLDLAALPEDAKRNYLDPAEGHLPASHFERVATEALCGAARRLLKPNHECARSTSRTARRWADRAIARLTWTESRSRLHTPADLLRVETMRMLREPGHFHRRFELAVSPTRWAKVAERFTWKQRQRLWS